MDSIESMASTPGPHSQTSTPGKETPKPAKFMNGWTKEQEDLMASWADIASCYRWMHDKCEKRYSSYNMMLSIPVIILSTLTGTANFAIDSFIPPNDDALKKYVQAGIGGISIFAGILTTLGNFLRFAQLSESNRVASISWGKLQRQIQVELRIHPNDRLDCLDFLKICRAELDRLIEQSPAIPDPVIKEFENEFKDIPKLKRPDIAHGMDHTEVFRDTTTMLKKLTADAAIVLKAKKKMLRDEVLPDLDRRITEALDSKLSVVVQQRMGELNSTIDRKVGTATEEAKRAAEQAALQLLHEKQKAEEEEQAMLRKRRLHSFRNTTQSSNEDHEKSDGVTLKPKVVMQQQRLPSRPEEQTAPNTSSEEFDDSIYYNDAFVEIKEHPETDHIGSIHPSSFRVIRPDSENQTFEIHITTSEQTPSESPKDETRVEETA